MNNKEIILIHTIKQCLKHKKRLNSSYNKMSSFMPLDSEKYLSLSEDEIEHIDQYIFRFSKLQDTIGKSLFKSVLDYLGEFNPNMPFIDIFNKLEQLEIIENIEIWNILRYIRNELAHEYEDNPIFASENINSVFDNKDNLLDYFENIFNYLKSRNVLDASIMS